ncbi:MAG TPA: hypothetical protein VGR50_03905 [Terriglobales bacterium]|nr:hypothetical protein [Terriglobales bacterium]
MTVFEVPPLLPTKTVCIGAVSDLSIGGLGLRLSMAPGMRAGLRPPLGDFTGPAGLLPAIELSVSWAKHLHGSSGQLVFDSGALWQLYAGGEQWTFDFCTPVLGAAPYKRMITNHDFSAGEILLNLQYFDADAPVYPLEYPLDEVLITHRLMYDSGIEIHGCGLADATGRGTLLVGHSGAGKSTTARLWNQSVRSVVLSDDRIILRVHKDGVWMYGTPWHGDEKLASPARCRLDRVLVLEHGSFNFARPMGASQAVSELLARSFVPMHSADAVREAITVLEAAAAQAPCYRFAFVPDFTAVDYVAGLHAN